MSIVTLHAAALSVPRGPGDASDGAYLLLSIVGPGASRESVHLPEGAHATLRQDQAIAPMPSRTFALEPGDSIRMVVSILEADRLAPDAELRAAQATTSAMAGSHAMPGAELLGTALAPLTALEAHWIGSATLLLTNEGGTLRWKQFDCLHSCSVLRSAEDVVLAPDATKAATGVVELTGSGATYHMQVALRRTA